MRDRARWGIYYLVAICLEAFILALFVRTLQFRVSNSFGYRYFLCLVLSTVILLPFFVVTRIGFAKPQRYVWRAIGTGFLAWTLIAGLHVLVFMAGLLNAIIVVYLFDVLTGFLLIWVFKLPSSFSILAVVFPGLALLYFLIYGQIRNVSESRKLEWIVAILLFLCAVGGFVIYSLPVSTTQEQLLEKVDFSTVAQAGLVTMDGANACHPSRCWGHLGCNYEICTRQDGTTYTKTVN